MDATETQQTETAEAKAQEQEQSQTQENLSDEQKLAAEALAATEEPAEESPEIEGLKREKEKLIGSITAMRKVQRELDQKMAEKLAAEKASQPPEKSPAEKYIEEHSDTFDPDTEPLPARVMIAQQKWEKEQSELSRRKQEQEKVIAQGNASYLKARQKYSDFDEILLEAEDLLTEGDQVDVRNAAKKGEDPSEKLYKICIYKILMAGGDRAKELRAKLKAKQPSNKASVQKKQEKQTDGSEKGGQKLKEETAQAPASAEETVTSPQLAHIYAAYGID